MAKTGIGRLGRRRRPQQGEGGTTRWRQGRWTRSGYGAGRRVARHGAARAQGKSEEARRGRGLAGLEALVAGAMTVGASGLCREQQGEGREGLCLTAAGGGLSGVGKAAVLAWPRRS